MLLVEAEARKIYSLERNALLAERFHVLKPIVRETTAKVFCVAYLDILHSQTVLDKAYEQNLLFQIQALHASRPIKPKSFKLSRGANFALDQDLKDFLEDSRAALNASQIDRFDDLR